MDWTARLERARTLHEERLGRPPDDPTRPDLHLAAVASASWAEGLACLMLGRDEEAASAFARAADEYAASDDVAPPGSWGRPLAALRCRLLAGRVDAAAEAAAVTDARRLLTSGAASEGSPIARYGATLALLTLGADEEAVALAEGLRSSDDFPRAVADALAALGAGDAASYRAAVRDVLRSFEERGAYLEDVPVADTVLVLEELARARGIAVESESALLPPRRGDSPAAGSGADR